MNYYNNNNIIMDLRRRRPLRAMNTLWSSLIAFPALGQFCAVCLTVQSGCCRPLRRNNVIAVLKRLKNQNFIVVRN